MRIIDQRLGRAITVATTMISLQQSCRRVMATTLSTIWIFMCEVLYVPTGLSPNFESGKCAEVRRTELSTISKLHCHPRVKETTLSTISKSRFHPRVMEPALSTTAKIGFSFSGINVLLLTILANGADAAAAIHVLQHRYV